MTEKPKATTKILYGMKSKVVDISTPMKAIRAYCIDCSGGSFGEAANCHLTDCPLWHFRKGKNPFRPKRVLTDERKAEIAARFKLAREKRAHIDSGAVDTVRE